MLPPGPALALEASSSALALTLRSPAGPAAAGRATEGSGRAVLLRSQGPAREEDQEQEVRLCRRWARRGGRGLGPGLGAGADPAQCVGMAKTGRKAERPPSSLGSAVSRAASCPKQRCVPEGLPSDMRSHSLALRPWAAGTIAC